MSVAVVSLALAYERRAGRWEAAHNAAVCALRSVAEGWAASSDPSEPKAASSDFCTAFAALWNRREDEFQQLKAAASQYLLAYRGECPADFPTIQAVVSAELLRFNLAAVRHARVVNEHFSLPGQPLIDVGAMPTEEALLAEIARVEAGAAIAAAPRAGETVH